MPQERISYDYDNQDTNIYKTSGYGGVYNTINDIERYTDDIDLSVYTGCGCDVKYLANNSTDDLVLSIYKRRDSSWTGNELSWKQSITISNDGLAHEYHYTIPEEYRAGHYRLGIKSSSTNTTFDVMVNIRRWRYTNTKR